MKHEIKLFGCLHVITFLTALILLVIIVYVYLNLNLALTSVKLRHTELITQSNIYNKLQQDKINLELIIGGMQQDLQQFSAQQTTNSQVDKKLTEVLYLSQIVELAQQVGLAIINCDPAAKLLNMTGDFQQIIDWLEELQILESKYFCKQLLINKMPRSLHIDYMYDMHTLAGSV